MKSRIIYGTSRKNNTEKCFEEVNAFLKHGSGENLHIIVPEQYSSYYEQLLVKKSIEKGSFQAEVLTFKRLAHRIFTRNLNLKLNYIDNAGKSMLMYDVINNVKEELKAFSKASAYPAFAGEALKMIREFKRYGLTVNDISEASKTAENRLLSSKLSELALMFSQFSKRLETSGFWDAEDDLPELANELYNSDGMERSLLWFDAFDGFTPAELLVVKALLEKSKAVTFSFCTDSLSARDRSDIFKPVTETAEKIKEIANNAGITTDIIKVSDDPDRINPVNVELEHLAANYFKYPETKFDNPVKAIKILKADSIFEEVERCAVEIINKVRNEELRFGDICIVSGLYDEYSSYIEAVFSNYEIPVFLDEKRSVSRHPAAAFILALLDIYIEKYSYESVFSYLKSPYSNFDSDDVSKLENYILEFDIKGVENWNGKDWDTMPYNLRDRSVLVDFNRIRSELSEKLQPIFDEFRYGLTGDEFSRLIFGFLQDNQVFEGIRLQADIASNEGRLEYSDELKQSWNILMDILDQVRTVAEEKKHTVTIFRNMLEIAFGQKKMGLIPPRTDVVFAGKPEKAFGINVKMLVILGTNDPGFPGTIMAEGLFSDKERNQLKENGIELAPDTTSQVIDRQIDIYNLLNLPTDSLYVSYSTRGIDGSEGRPSGFIDRILDIFPGFLVESCRETTEDTNILTPLTGLSWAVANKEFNPALTEWYKENGYEHFFDETDDSISESEFKTLIGSMLGEVLETSATALESYAACPFRYFSDYILKAKERREFSISPPDVGSILHDILKSLVSKFENINNADYSDYISEAADSFEKLEISKIFNRNSRMKYLGQRIVSRAVDAYITVKNQIEAGEFKPIEYETSFGRNRNLGAPRYQAGDSRVYLKGRIDRVDGALLKNGEFFRIIDYKSSYKDIKLCRIKEGLDIQLPLYMMAYKNFSGSKPAGMYYFNASKKIVNVDYNTDSDTIKTLIQKDAKLSGYTLSDPDVISAMDSQLSGSSTNISVRLNASGGYSGKLITTNDIESINKVLEKHIIEKTKSIYEGDYEVIPVRFENSWACEICGFKGICGFDKNKPGCRYRSVADIKDKELEWEDHE